MGVWRFARRAQGTLELESKSAGSAAPRRAGYFKNASAAATKLSSRRSAAHQPKPSPPAPRPPPAAVENPRNPRRPGNPASAEPRSIFGNSLENAPASSVAAGKRPLATRGTRETGGADLREVGGLGTQPHRRQASRL